MADTYSNPRCYGVCGYIALLFFSKQLLVLLGPEEEERRGQITLAKYSYIIVFTNFFFAGITVPGFGLLNHGFVPNPAASSDFITFSGSLLLQTETFSPPGFRFVITISGLLIAMSLSLSSLIFNSKL